MKKNKEEPWTWMKGIRTGLNEKGERKTSSEQALANIKKAIETLLDESI